MFVIQVLSFLILLYGLVGLAGKFFKTTESVRNQGGGYSDIEKSLFILPFSKPSIIVGAIVWSLSSLIVKVDGQSVGVLVTPNGVSENEMHTGWHVIMPWQDLNFMDKTVWVYTCSNNPKEGQKIHADAIWAPTKDGIKMGFDVSVSWKINPNQASWIYQNVAGAEGSDESRYIWLEENVIRPKLKSTLALTVSNYSPIQVYSNKREEIQNEIIKRMKSEVAKYNLIIDQVDLREVFYNKDYETSINNKKLAEQEALRLVEVTKQVEELKKQESIKKDIKILTAEGEAKSLQIKGQSISNNPKIIQLEWVSKWDGVLPTYMMGSGQGVMLNLNNKE